MPLKYEQSLNRCVLIDADRLEQLVADTKLSSDKLSIALECSDSVRRTYDSLESVRSYHNRPSAAIRELSLKIGKYSDSESFRIVFRSSFLLKSVECEAQSEDEEVLRSCRDALDSFFDRNAPWWAIFGRIDYAGWRAILVLTGISILATWWSQKWSMISLIPLAPVAFGWLLAATVPSVFPRSIFLIGAGDARFHRAEIWRVVVLVGFAISLVASIVATELYRH